MSGDEEFGSGGAEELRSLLRQWKAPAAPAGMEDRLRQTFRRRRRSRQRNAWLAVAASVVVALAAISRIGAPRPEPPALGERSAARPSAAPPPTVPRVDPTPRESLSQRAAVGPQRALRPTRPRPEPQVVVEPGQAALLTQLAQEWGGAREGPAAVVVPEAITGELPRFQTVWETVGGAWPPLQRAESRGVPQLK